MCLKTYSVDFFYKQGIPATNPIQVNAKIWSRQKSTGIFNTRSAYLKTIFIYLFKWLILNRLNLIQLRFYLWQVIHFNKIFWNSIKKKT